jgi:TetR/AcrR family transcriptional regulator
MDKIIDQNTELKILQSAEYIFQKEGFTGARMQAIANHASINKAMLHYYFRSKDALFMKVFESKYNLISNALTQKINSENSLLEIMYEVIDIYYGTFLEHPYMPGMVLCTFNYHPEFVEKIERKAQVAVLAKFKESMASGEIKPIDPIQVMTTIMSLCIAPFAAKPLMMHSTGLNEKQFFKMLHEKKDVIKKIVKNMLFN